MKKSERLSLEDILDRDGVLTYKTQGISMEPMLYQNRDLVEVTRKNGRLKPMDVALYKAGNGAYILHRVIKVNRDGYLIRGDNTIGSELVSEKQVIGVLTRFVRKGKEIEVTDPGYLMYARIRQATFPLRIKSRKVKQKIWQLLAKVKHIRN